VCVETSHIRQEQWTFSPEMQEELLKTAGQSGADIRRSAVVIV
jgi:hypothetical protein